MSNRLLPVGSSPLEVAAAAACAELAARYNIISVHVLPCWTRFLVRCCRSRGRER